MLPRRRSTRQSLPLVKQMSSSSDNNDSRKRSQSDLSDPEVTPKATQSKRIKPSSATPKKSKYFTKGLYESANIDHSDDSSPSSDDEDVSESDFDAATPTSASASGSDEENNDESEDSDFDKKPKRKSLSMKKPVPSRTKASAAATKAARTDLDIADMEPGVEIIIKKPKARPAGKTPYKDESVHPNTLLFLRELKENNQREWLKLHDPNYRASLNDWNTFIEKVTEKLTTDIDDTIPELPIKDIVFRIYRDIRFSKDPTPYKTYFSAAWSRTGRKGPYAAYYLQIAPGSSFIGAGCWHPEAGPLAAIRSNVDHKPHKLKAILSEQRMRKEFLGGVVNKAEKVVQAFVSTKSNAESALKTKPKGYGADHKDIALMKLRSFTVGRSLKDEEIVKSDFLHRVADLMSVMAPFVSHLNSVVMPDPDASESSSEEGSDTA